MMNIYYPIIPISITEKNNLIQVRGIKSYLLSLALDKTFGTKRIQNNLFKRFMYSGFDMHSFFAVDFVFMLEHMIEKDKSNVSKRSLSVLKDKFIKNTWLNTIQDDLPLALDYDKLKNLKWTPLKHQQDFLEHYDRATRNYRLKGELMHFAAGTGKTFTTIALTEVTNTDTTIIISPKNALDRVWMPTIRDVYHKPQSLWMVNGKTPFTGKERYIVINYEFIHKLIPMLYKIPKGNKVLVALDESHNFAVTKSERTKGLLELVKYLEPANSVFLSGTPIKSSALEMVTLLYVMDPLFTPTVEQSFRKVFAGNVNNATPIITNRLGKVSFKAEKEVAKLEDPVYHYHDVTFKGSEAFTLPVIAEEMRVFIGEREVYYKKTAQEDRVAFMRIVDDHGRLMRDVPSYMEYRRCLDILLKSNAYMHLGTEMAICNNYEKNTLMPNLAPEDLKVFKEIKAQVKYVTLKIVGEALGTILSKARINCNVKVAEHVDFKSIIESTKKKTVIFTNNIAVGTTVMERLVSEGYQPLGVFGDTVSDLSKTVKTFDEVAEANPLVATYASLSTAVPLTMADTVVILDAPFREYTLNQAVSRVHRLGADTVANIHHIRLDTGEEPNIANRSIDILKWSSEQVENITGIRPDIEIMQADGIINTSSLFGKVPDFIRRFFV